MNDKKPYERDEAYLAHHRKMAHPNIQGLSDYGISSLSPDIEDYCKRLCEANGMCYERIRDAFEVGTQVIGARQTNPINIELIERGVMPINDLDLVFRAYIRSYVHAAVEAGGKQYIVVPRKIDK